MSIALFWGQDQYNVEYGALADKWLYVEYGA